MPWKYSSLAHSVHSEAEDDFQEKNFQGQYRNPSIVQLGLSQIKHQELYLFPK